jgi:hypothetical protein
MTFEELEVGTEFVDEQCGGLWRKLNTRQAVCMESDSGYKAGEVAPFGPADGVTFA